MCKCEKEKVHEILRYAGGDCKASHANTYLQTYAATWEETSYCQHFWLVGIGVLLKPRVIVSGVPFKDADVDIPHTSYNPILPSLQLIT